MRVFIDTSAFLAILDGDDIYHQQTKEAWVDLVASDNILLCNNYIIIETFAVTSQ